MSSFLDRYFETIEIEGPLSKDVYAREATCFGLLSYKFPNIDSIAITRALNEIPGEPWRDEELRVIITRADVRAIHEYNNELEGMLTQDLFTFYRQESAAAGIDIDDADMPPMDEKIGWFYDQPDAQADFEHWSRAEYWTPDEAVAVSFGKNPNVVNANTLKSYLGKASFADEYYLRRDLVDRAVATGHLPEEIPPADFIDWSQRKRLNNPEDLIEHLDALSATPTRFWDGFDVHSPTYPEELDIAFQAWRAISKHCDPDRTPKQQIRSWVSSNYPGVKTEALERISVMCNWAKQGGRKKKD